MEETIGKRIARYRKEKGMTQEALAEIMGISAQAVSKWENDASYPEIGLLPLLSKTLGVTTDAILTGKDDKVKVVPESQRKSLDAMTLRIRVISAEGDKIRVNLPMSLVKMAMSLGIEIGPAYLGENGDALKGVDLKKIVDLVEQGMVGKIVEVESSSGDIVEVVVE